MTQIILHQGKQGIILATDGRAVTRPSGERRDYFQVQKVFPLGPHAVLITGGAGYGVLLCRLLQSRLESVGATHFDDIAEMALPFLLREKEKIHQDGLYRPDVAELQRVYFLLGGRRPDTPEHPFAAELLGSEFAGDPLHVIKIGHVVAIPRHLGIEYRLSRLIATDDELNEVEALCENLLLKVSGENLDVGPPFFFVRITADEIKIRAVDSPPEAT